jgi:hypothetical protein
MATGVYTVADLASITSTTAVNFGLPEIRRTLDTDLAAYNDVLDEMVGDIAERTTDRERIYGASASGEMFESDEYDRGVTIKAGAGSNVGFPLKKFVVDVGWTRDYMLQNTPAQIANTVVSIQGMHTRAVRRELQRALFDSANATVVDRFQSPQINLAVKRLVNADSASIPNGPNGETFNAATHTHYDFLDGAAPTAAALTALIEDVVEHGHGGRVLLNINRAAETAVRALTGFNAYTDPRLTLGTQANQPGQRLDISRIDNRAIGLFGAAEVWVRSWVPAGYVLAYDAAATQKPLVYRQHPVQSVRGLRIVATLEDYPLYAEVMDSYFGFAAFNRTSAAVLYYAASASAYVVPTFTGA